MISKNSLLGHYLSEQQQYAGSPGRELTSGENDDHAPALDRDCDAEGKKCSAAEAWMEPYPCIHGTPFQLHG